MSEKRTTLFSSTDLLMENYDTAFTCFEVLFKNVVKFLAYLESVPKGGMKKVRFLKKMVHQVISDGQRDVIFISYLLFST